MALAGLFVIAYAMELSGLLAWLIRKAKGMTRLFGRHAVWIVIGLCGAVGGFLNNTPVVVLAAPVVRDMALSLGLSPKRFLMPLSYAVIMGAADPDRHLDQSAGQRHGPQYGPAGLLPV